MTVACRIIIHGRVQGVGYRYAALDAAERLGVTGWVRNRRDGAVEAFVQGDTEAVAAMLVWCRRGPGAAQVTSVEAADAVPESLREFSLRQTL